MFDHLKMVNKRLLICRILIECTAIAEVESILQTCLQYFPTYSHTYSKQYSDKTYLCFILKCCKKVMGLDNPVFFVE